MDAKMPGKITAVCKTSRTNSTFEGFFASMRAYVSLQIAVLCKPSLANVALVGLFSSVYHLMYFQMSTLHKTLFTLVAFVGFLGEMGPAMRIEVAELTETSVTHITHVLLIRMSLLMAVQVTQPLKTNTTINTFVRFLNTNSALIFNNILDSRPGVMHRDLCY